MGTAGVRGGTVAGAGGEPPGPRGVSGLGVLPQLARDPAGMCTSMQRRYGHVVRLPVLTRSVYLLTHPDGVEQVLVSGNRNHWKGDLFGRTSFLFGRGLVLNDGASWQNQRRTLQPSFGADAVKRLASVVGEVVERRSAKWRSRPSSDAIDMEAEMMSLTLEVVAASMFSTALDDDTLTRLTAAFGTVLQHIGVRMATFALPSWVPVPGERRAKAALAVLDDFVHDHIAGRVAMSHRDERGDLLDVLLSASDEQGVPLAGSAVRDEVVTVLFGGYEATAHALAWAWYLLDRHPAVADRLHEEADAAGDEGTLGGVLPYTRQVIEETLRLYPPFWEVLRSSYGPQEVGGFFLPANASILLCPYTTQRLPELWEDAASFRPDRFEPNGEASRVPRHAYFPFGAGQRSCIGRHLALLEMQVVLARLGREFTPALVGSGPVRHRAQSTLRSRDGLRMHLARR